MENNSQPHENPAPPPHTTMPIPAPPIPTAYGAPSLQPITAPGMEALQMPQIAAEIAARLLAQQTITAQQPLSSPPEAASPPRERDNHHTVAGGGIPENHDFFDLPSGTASTAPLRELYLRPGQSLVVKFLKIPPVRVNLHTLWEDRKPTKLACSGTDCPLCEMSDGTALYYLVAVFDPKAGAIKYLVVENEVTPHSLRFALTAYLRRPDLEALAIKVHRIDRDHYEVIDTGRPSDPPGFVAARDAFIASGGEIRLREVFPVLPPVQLAMVPVVRRLLAKFGWADQEGGDPFETEE